MKLKKSLLAFIVVCGLVLLPACEPPDVEDIAIVIEQTSAIAYNEVINNKPELEEPLMELAKISIGRLNGEPIDAVKAKEMLYSALSNFSSLEEDDKRIIVNMFSIVIPLMEIPKEGALEKPQLILLEAFFQGILNASEINEELKTDEEVETILSNILEGD